MKKKSTPELKQTDKEVQGPGETEAIENSQWWTFVFYFLLFIFSLFILQLIYGGLIVTTPADVTMFVTI